MKRLLLGFIILGALWGQSPSYSDLRWIKTWYDEFEGLTITTNRIPLENSALHPRQVIQYSTGQTWYWMHYDYSGYTLFFPSFENSLVFLADGTKISLSTDYDLVSGDGAFYKITASQLEKIAYANVVKVRISSRNTYIDSEFSEESFRAARIFYEVVIEKKWGDIETLKETAERAYDSANVEIIIQNIENYTRININTALKLCDKYGWKELKERLEMATLSYAPEMHLELEEEELKMKEAREKDSLFVHDVLHHQTKYKYMDVRSAIAKCREYGWEEERKKLEQLWKELD